eukprot:TRINITY_DN18008_c0_g2_i1.p1 TRINITY_DN18008_c0_g2~~TRINITY_DN18008_c0_g2_i1.p1  ORF type:complete len:182 (+),score=9.02 TRINITY_DN18008_c0_g2_i1:172-717(+)
MKKYFAIVAIALLSVNFGSCSNGNVKSDEKKSPEVSSGESKSIQILYFHGDRRCPTCIKVGEVSLNLFNTKYSSNAVVSYKDVNIDKDENKAIAEKYQVTGSSLLIDVNGEVKNITVDAFKYARTEPAKLETIITDIIEKGLKKQPMEWLQNLLDSSNLPILSAFLLGILTSISPCPCTLR